MIGYLTIRGGDWRLRVGGGASALTTSRTWEARFPGDPYQALVPIRRGYVR